MRHFTRLVAAGLVLAATPLAAKAPIAAKQVKCATCSADLDRALADQRRADDRTRDGYRHPSETLGFFGIRPGMTVVDVMPGGGWYTRVLVPYLGDSGHYIAVAPPPTDAAPDFASTFPAKAKQWAGYSPERVSAYNSDAIPASLDGKVDRVLIFREVHNIVQAGTLARDLDTYRRLLKPDGQLGIVEHRAKPEAPASYVDGSKGYMKQADVIREIEKQGFELVGTSEINANPKDTADYPRGVWTLPPSYTLKDVDRDKYAAIGESDRMTLLFRKRG